MSLPLAARSASVARCRACSADPLASEMPAWACLLTSSMRVSLLFTHSCVFSTSALRVSTFWLTSPTSRPTYFLVAQPERATAAASIGTTNRIEPPFQRWAAARPPSGTRNIATAGPDQHALARAVDLDTAEAGRPPGRVVTETVLVLELAEYRGRGALQPAEVAHGEARAAGKLGVAREQRRALGGGGGPLPTREERRGRIVHRRHHAQGVDRHVQGL